MDRSVTRRALIGGSLSVAASPLIAAPAHADGGRWKDEAATRYGRVRGRRQDGIVKFLGVPYATPPLGKLRFRAPQPLKPWHGVRDAVDFPNPAYQVAGAEMGPGGNGRMPAPSEDCLYLNIWTPAADGKRRPVMFYNHGGGYMIGSGSATGQDGTRLAMLHDVVVVESNHRLGLLGYLFLGDLARGDYAANQGMLDILAALRWTAENIENFGGDPDNIMVWGESGGGAKTAAVYTMPKAARLFHKASIESAAPLRFPTRAGATARAERTLHLLGLTRTDIRTLHDIPAARLLEIQVSEAANGVAPWGEPDPVLPGFGAFVDGTIIPRHPFADGAAPFSAGKPLMVGTTRDEMVFFGLFGPKDIFSIDDAGLRSRLSATYQGADLDRIIATFRRSRPNATPAQLYFAITTSPIWRDAIKIAEAKEAQRWAPVYMYQLAYPDPTLVPGTDFPLGSPHASDIPLKFDTLSRDSLPGQLATARHMSALWAGFARDGRPNAPGVPRWPTYTRRDRATMWIDATCRIVNDPDQSERLYWESRA
ncbi:carboxylic ester hydrolase [Actinoplanes lobatus]|uniref:Carboxylic ester hydrolase n=1 Tax=Actinoplanes lobatus TaxID=113568 RepID=A0A7W7HL73_9ACTN|nr:carboxylesterase family protein [Actinoplanes lobatus]MBB4752578.1 para-nitrobenzyl esterase [Actinoplanes lobatus]GGN97935.1 carboxylic ester hydrolase [Actinoplanes lobatus]GIE45854.1 carboxylic ester hydrolase [Actinoplanes lobatus]